MRRHPPGLYVLFFTEMWERFGFYTMAALFILYMKDPSNGHPGLQQYASLINGLYLGTVYFTPFFGGILADQKIGYRWSIVFGALVFALGYFLLAVDNLVFFWLGLGGIVIGNGLFKPNISTLVGKLYTPGDPRLDSAYNIFYMGINMGALAAPFVAQYLRVRYGYHVGFAAAGVGMILSLAFFLPFQRWLPAEPVPWATALREFVVWVVLAPVGLVLLGRSIVSWRRAERQPPAESDVPPQVQRERHIALLIIFVVVALFWMGFKQNANTFPLWFRDATDRVPPSWFPQWSFLLDKQGWFAQELSAAINPFYVIAFTPLLVGFWRWLRSFGKEPSTPAKIGIGMVLTALAFLVLTAGALAGGDMDKDGVRVSAGYLFGGYAVITLGELCLSPMGLSLVSKLAAPHQRSAWMGGWFAATAIGGYLSGLIGQFWDAWPHSQFFAFLAGTSLLAGLVLLVFYRRLVAAMPPVKPPSA